MSAKARPPNLAPLLLEYPRELSPKPETLKRLTCGEYWDYIGIFILPKKATGCLLYY